MNAEDDGGSDLAAVHFLIHFRSRFALTHVPTQVAIPKTPGSRQAASRRPSMPYQSAADHSDHWPAVSHHRRSA
jgi:hypothetical protein